MADLTTQEWREINEELVERITDQQREFGQIPDEKSVRDWMDDNQIMRKLEVDKRPEPKAKPVLTDYDPDHKKEKVNRVSHDGVAIIEKEFDAARHASIRERSKDSIVKFFQGTVYKHPEWSAAADQIMKSHMILDPYLGKFVLTRRGKDLMVAFYELATRHFGDPLKPQEAKIFSHG